MKIFIDGEYGTAGLHLSERIKTVKGAELLSLSPCDKKDKEKRGKLLNEADFVFLCLPDNAAAESAGMVENPKTVIIDCSTAHRTAWTYGFPELDKKFRDEIAVSNRISNPGCHATGFCAIVYPLVKHGLLLPDQTVYSYSLTGYSGGGREKIAEYEDGNIRGASIYSLEMQHKHLAEMQKVCGLKNPPLFSPVIVDVPRGMLVSAMLKLAAEHVYEVLRNHYEHTGIDVQFANGLKQLDMQGLNDSNKLIIYVSGNKTQAFAVSQMDNLGKGASGAAVQNFKIRMGVE